MKIQLKRSNQLDGGSAKEPSIGYMEYGELAVNFNEADPCIFIKTSDGAGNDSIVRIAGAGAEGGGLPNGGTDERPDTPSIGELFFDTDLNLIVYWDGSQWVPVLDKDTTDSYYVEVTGDNMTGDLTLGTDKITLDATDGGAAFGNDVQIGKFKYGNNESGCYIFAGGSYHANASVATGTVFRGYLDEAIGSTINAQGDATFEGEGSFGYGSSLSADRNETGQRDIIALKAYNYSNDKDLPTLFLHNKGDSNGGRLIECFNSSNTSVASVDSNGAAEFAAGDASINSAGEFFTEDRNGYFIKTGGQDYSAGIFSTIDSSAVPHIVINAGNLPAISINETTTDVEFCGAPGNSGSINTPLASIKSDGSANFNGDGLFNKIGGNYRNRLYGGGLISSFNSFDSSSIGMYLDIGDAGSANPPELDLTANSGATGDALLIQRQGQTSPDVKLKYDGTGTFNSTVRSNGGFLAYPPSDSTYSFATRNAADDKWSAYITGEGSAQFASFVESTNGSAQSALFPDGTAVITEGIYLTDTNQIRFLNANGPSGSGSGSLYFGNAQLQTTLFYEIWLEPDNDANYVTTTEEYTETESYTGPLGNTLEREVTKTRDVRTYTGPTLDVKERLQNVLSRVDAIEANEVADDATDSALLQLVASLTARLDEKDEAIASLTDAFNALIERVTTLES